MQPVIARRYFISGRVQGVGFRYYAQRMARQIPVSGWVRNLDDGRVEICANGTADKLSDFEARIRQGPAHADIRSVEVLESSPFEATEFYIR
jgi:acylphosphatase